MTNLRFSLKPLGRNTVEVRSHRIKYVCQIQGSSLKLKAFKDEVLQEQADLRLKASNRRASLALELKDHENRTLRAEVQKNGNQLSTVIVLNGVRYQVAQPDVKKHGIELARTLSGVRGPRARYTGWFMKDLRNHKPFSKAVSKHTDLAPLADTQNSNPWICAALCTCCALLILEPIPGDEIPCCMLCVFCLAGLEQ